MNGWTRVDRQNPCPICGKPDWCMVGERLVCCMRVEGPRMSLAESGGWLHPIDTQPRNQNACKANVAPMRPIIDAGAIMRGLWEQTTDDMRQVLAGDLGLTVNSLRLTGCSWDGRHRTWNWPMFDGQRHCIGIRTRNAAGQKRAVTGSRSGLFWPRMSPETTLFVVEGPTDLCAALDLGLFALGRPDCQSGVAHLQIAVNHLSVRRVVQIADNDGPGIRGAKHLADELQVPCASILLPAKDLRQFLNLGGTAAVVNCLLGQAIWHQP
jgi:hypothetical protein